MKSQQSDAKGYLSKIHMAYKYDKYWHIAHSSDFNIKAVMCKIAGATIRSSFKTMLFGIALTRLIFIVVEEISKR